MKSKLNLLKEFATRKRTGFIDSIYKALPDPDKILEENNYEFEIYRDLMSDPHLMATMQQRKMQVMQMGWELICDDEINAKVKSSVYEMLRKLPLGKIMSDTLDAIFFGYSVGEIEYRKSGKLIEPVDVIGKPQEWFIFTKNNELRLRKFNNGIYLFEEGEKLPEFKFILTQYNPTYVNPYGQRVLSRCYWPVHLKRGGIEFWQLMMERYGMPYLIGKYPNTFTKCRKLNSWKSCNRWLRITLRYMRKGLELKLRNYRNMILGSCMKIF